ncbi:MAG TPA: hypothetical protein VJO13_16985, partial [Ktedonobacterales bacterium]|nr:hypothetical protein [Ktedonobacterales bacterium]
MPARTRMVRTPAPTRPAQHPQRPPATPATPATRNGRVPSTRQTTPHQAPRPAPRPQPQHMEWPATFDDWMIDIVRRRALRLNSGARRRGVIGAVRAVELAHVLEHARNGNGQWLCGICK